MSGLFHQPKPRPFTHRFLFIDERRERMRLLREAMQKDKVQQQAPNDKSRRHARLHNGFAEAAQQRRKQRRASMMSAWIWGMLAAVAATLALLLLGASC